MVYSHVSGTACLSPAGKCKLLTAADCSAARGIAAASLLAAEQTKMDSKGKLSVGEAKHVKLIM